MARIQKYHTGIKKVIQHNIREFKDGKCPTNLEVNPEKTKYNYSLIRRGNTAAEIEAYRKRITKAFRILVPKGSHVKYMGNVNFEEHYYEVDIQHGAKLQVISADKEYINCLLVSTN